MKISNERGQPTTHGAFLKRSKASQSCFAPFLRDKNNETPHRSPTHVWMVSQGTSATLYNGRSQDQVARAHPVNFRLSWHPDPLLRTCMACAVHSHPALVVIAYWNGVVVVPTAGASCFAMVRSTDFLITFLLATVPCAPPLFFWGTSILPKFMMAACATLKK